MREMNLENKWDYEKLQANRDQIKKVFFYRICGTGMGSAACLLKEKGFHVEGADNNFFPPMSTYLDSTGIPCHQLSDINQDKLKEFDLIVVGNVVPRNSDDAAGIEEAGVPFASFPTTLGALVLSDVNVVGVSGTHGKTTTTYFFSQVFEKLGMTPGHLIGGVIEGRSSSALGDGKYFFIESDEYDSAYFEKISKFRSYSINNLVLTSLEFDHADIFNDIEDIKNEFRALIPKVDKTFIVSSDYPAAKELKEEFDKDDNWLLYGEKSSLGPRNIRMESSGTSFEICLSGDWIDFKTDMIGLHNILNLTTVILFAYAEGFNKDDIQEAISSMRLVKRRQEVRGEFKGCPIIDDFAHHPRAVDLTIETIKVKYPDKKVVVVFEPHSATARSALFQDDFTKALAKAHEVIFTKLPRPTSVKEVGDLDCEKMVSELEDGGTPASIVSDLEQLLSAFESKCSGNEVVLILSNGTCLGLWQSEFASNLK